MDRRRRPPRANFTVYNDPAPPPEPNQPSSTSTSRESSVRTNNSGRRLSDMTRQYHNQMNSRRGMAENSSSTSRTTSQSQTGTGTTTGTTNSRSRGRTVSFGSQTGNTYSENTTSSNSNMNVHVGRPQHAAPSISTSSVGSSQYFPDNASIAHRNQPHLYDRPPQHSPARDDAHLAYRPVSSRPPTPHIRRRLRDEDTGESEPPLPGVPTAAEIAYEEEQAHRDAVVRHNEMLALDRRENERRESERLEAERRERQRLYRTNDELARRLIEEMRLNQARVRSNAAPHLSPSLATARELRRGPRSPRSPSASMAPLVTGERARTPTRERRETRDREEPKEEKIKVCLKLKSLRHIVQSLDAEGDDTIVDMTVPDSAVEARDEDGNPVPRRTPSGSARRSADRRHVNRDVNE